MHLYYFRQLVVAPDKENDVEKLFSNCNLGSQLSSKLPFK